VHKKRYYIPETEQWVTLKVSAHAMRNINKIGVYDYLKQLEAKGVDTGVVLG
jgi:large subunit ribosomal protein L28